MPRKSLGILLAVLAAAALTLPSRLGARRVRSVLWSAVAGRGRPARLLQVVQPLSDRHVRHRHRLRLRRPGQVRRLSRKEGIPRPHPVQLDERGALVRFHLLHPRPRDPPGQALRPVLRPQGRVRQVSQLQLLRHRPRGARGRQDHLHLRDDQPPPDLRPRPHPAPGSRGRLRLPLGPLHRAPRRRPLLRRDRRPRGPRPQVRPLRLLGPALRHLRQPDPSDPRRPRHPPGRPGGTLPRQPGCRLQPGDRRLPQVPESLRREGRLRRPGPGPVRRRDATSPSSTTPRSAAATS